MGYLSTTCIWTWKSPADNCCPTVTLCTTIKLRINKIAYFLYNYIRVFLCNSISQRIRWALQTCMFNAWLSVQPDWTDAWTFFPGFCRACKLLCKYIFQIKTLSLLEPEIHGHTRTYWLHWHVYTHIHICARVCVCVFRNLPRLLNRKERIACV